MAMCFTLREGVTKEVLSKYMGAWTAVWYYQNAWKGV